MINVYIMCDKIFILLYVLFRYLCVQGGGICVRTHTCMCKLCAYTYALGGVGTPDWTGIVLSVKR